MRRVVWKTLFCAGLVARCGAAPTMSEMNSVLEQMVEVMKTIKDAGGAKAAVPKLDALADKVLDYRERLKKALREQAKSGKRMQMGDAADGKKGASVREAYEGELERISSIPGAPQQLDGFIKKMKPDPELNAALGAALQDTLAETAKKAAADGPPDLRPDPNFKDRIPDVMVTSVWRKWFPSAKKGDFVQIAEQLGGTRHEVVEVAGETVVVASVHQIATSKLETRVRMKYGPEPEPLPPGLAYPEPKPAGTETVTVAGRSLVCQVKKDGKRTLWYCDEVPFDGLVKEESPNKQVSLVSFGRGTGPSPNVVASSPPAPAATAPTRPTPPGRPLPMPTPPAAAPSTTANGQSDALIQQKIDDQQATMDKCLADIERLNDELKEAKEAVEGLEKKIKRLATSAKKTKRARDSKSEFQRELQQARSQVSKTEREIKKNEDQIARCKQAKDKLQAQMAVKP